MHGQSGVLAPHFARRRVISFTVHVNRHYRSLEPNVGLIDNVELT